MSKSLFFLIICSIALIFLLHCTKAKPWPQDDDDDSSDDNEFDNDDEEDGEDSDEDDDYADLDDDSDNNAGGPTNEKVIPVTVPARIAQNIVAKTIIPPPTAAPVLRQNPALKGDYERCKNDPACSYNYCAAEPQQADCEEAYLNCNGFVFGDKSSAKRGKCTSGNKYSVVMRTCVSEPTCDQSRQPED